MSPRRVVARYPRELLAGIGDGVGRRYRVPAGATRLFLGFADAYLYQGSPGWYDNNAGRLSVTVQVDRDEGGS